MSGHASHAKRDLTVIAFSATGAEVESGLGSNPLGGDHVVLAGR